MDLISEKQALLKSAGFPHDLGKVEEIKAGANNRLFHLWTTDGQELVLKEYLRDDRHRLEREYSACSFLASVGFEGTAKAVFKDDEQNFGVYSFCPGVRVRGAEVTQTHIGLVADWIARLHAIAPDRVTIPFRDIPYAVFCPYDFLRALNDRYQLLLNDQRSGPLHPLIQQFVETTDLFSLVHKINHEAFARFGEETLLETLDQTQWRLSPADFGLHNALFDGDRLTIVDLEYFGWDDPVRALVDFLHHDQQRDIPKEVLSHFMSAYREKAHPSDKFLERFEAANWLCQREWIGTMLTSITRKKLADRLHANPEFDETAYITKQISKIHGRVKDLGYAS